MPRSVRNTTRSTAKPTTRARNTTKVLTTPWIRVSVTMSPLATWLISWPSTASISSRFMDSSRPVETATSAEFLKAPVAKALGAPSKTATSGMPMFALSARRRTVATSHCSCAPSGCSIARAGRPFRHGLGNQQREDRAGEADDQRESEQHLEVESVFRQEPVYSERAQDDREPHHHREVGRDKEEDAFHVFGLRAMEVSAKVGPQSGNSSVAPGRDRARDCIPSAKLDRDAIKAKRRESPAFPVLRGPWGRVPLSSSARPWPWLWSCLCSSSCRCRPSPWRAGPASRLARGLLEWLSAPARRR